MLYQNQNWHWAEFQTPPNVTKWRPSSCHLQLVHHKTQGWSGHTQPIHVSLAGAWEQREMKAKSRKEIWRGRMGCKVSKLPSPIITSSPPTPNHLRLLQQGAQWAHRKLITPLQLTISPKPSPKSLVLGFLASHMPPPLWKGVTFLVRAKPMKGGGNADILIWWRQEKMEKTIKGDD